MFKTCLVLALLGCLTIQQNQCNTTQQQSILSAVGSQYPSRPITDQIDLPVKLKDIPFTVNTTSYTISQIVADPIIYNVGYNTISLKEQELTIPTSFYVTFSVEDSNNVVLAVGSGLIETTDLVINLTLGLSLVQFSVTSVALTEDKLVNDVSLSVTTNYDQIVQALNTGGSVESLSVSQQIQAYFNGDDFRNLLNQDIKTYLQTRYSDGYVYNYTNINGNSQTVSYNTTVLSVYQQGDRLSVERVLSIIGFDNQCEEKMPEPLTSYENRTAFEITAISIAQIESTFLYALQQKYFDTQLNKVWNSPIFQFNVGSLQNVLSGLKGNYQANSPSTGKCTANAKLSTIAVGTDNLLNVTIPYDCQISLNSLEPIATVSFTLSLSLDIKTSSNPSQLIVSGNSVTLSSVLIRGSVNFAPTNIILANLYIQSIVENAFVDQNLFGSGFQTLDRKLSIAATIVGADLIVYEYIQQQSTIE